MAWVAVDVSGEWIYDRVSTIALPKGSIKKLIGKELTWSDEPVKLE